MPNARIPLATKIKREQADRKRLELILPCLIEKDPESYVRVSTLRRLLGLCGVNAHSVFLTELLTTRFDTYLETVRQGEHRRVTLPGTRLRADGLARARAVLAKEWNARLSDELLFAEPLAIPVAHRQAPPSLPNGTYYVGRESPGSPSTSMVCTLVRLPHDWSDEAIASSDFGIEDRIMMTAANREAAGVYNSAMGDYVWRLCDWSMFPRLERELMEAHVIHGLQRNELAAKFGTSTANATRILQRHRARAGIRPRDGQVRVSRKKYE